MTQQPEALRLADELDAYHTAPHHKEAAAELRRLEAVNAQLLEALEEWEKPMSKGSLEVHRILRTAIEQAESVEPVAWAVFEGWNAHDLYLPQEYDEALKMAGYKGDHAEVKPLYTTPPAQPAPVQEPVGVVHHKPTSLFGADCEQVAVFTRALAPGTKLYTTPPAAPVQFKCTVVDDQHPNGIPLEQWGNPPAAQRQPLTDEKIWLEYQRFWPFHPAEEPRLAKDIAKFARAIEAAHGIKENT